MESAQRQRALTGGSPPGDGAAGARAVGFAPSVRPIRPARDGLLVAAAILFVTSVAALVLYQRAAEAQRAEVRSHLLRLAHAAASVVDGDAHRTLVSPGQRDSEAYNRILNPLRSFLRNTPGVKYVYTAVLLDDGIHFVVDSALPVDGDGDGVIDQAGLLERYDDANPYMLVALREDCALTTPEPYSDKWGTFMTGFVPLRDSAGTQAGIVAVDITAEQYERQLGGVRMAAMLAMAPAIALSALAGLGCFRLRRREARLVSAIREALERTTREQVVLAEIAASPATAAGDVPQLARELTERGAAALHVERAGVWLFDESQTLLRCVDTYEAAPRRHSSGAVLPEREYRNEFDALKTQRYVNADDALTDPRTAGYVQNYLVPLGITSMLDAAIRSSGVTLGVMCFEHVGPPRRWAPDEIAFACRLADQVALALASDERQRARALAEESMRRQERTLRDLERLNSAMAGREERLLELKAEVNALLAELHRVPRYRVTAADDAPEPNGVPRP